MALPDLRVKPGVVSAVGHELLDAANAIPAAPRPVSPAGVDALSATIAAHVTSVVAPLVAGRPAAKQQAQNYAQALPAAARAYAGTDQPLADGLDRQLSGMSAAG